VISVKKGIVHNHYGGFSFDASDMVTVLRSVRAQAGIEEKVCLFWDNARFHKASLVQEEAKSPSTNIQLCYNLPFRPDLNPCELVFRKVKNLYRREVDRLKALNR
jgi:transposase